jgi:hypothetical protein
MREMNTMSGVLGSTVLIMRPGQPAEKILVDNLDVFIADALGSNIQHVKFGDELILYDGNARKRGELMNSIIGGETIVGDILCISQITPISIGLEDDRANQLLKFSCFEKAKPVSMSKYLR